MNHAVRIAAALALLAASAARAADFNGDGFADLAVASNSVDLANGATGGLHLFYGGPNGIGIKGSALVSAIEGVDMLVFATLATGDFDGDGFDDLAFGCPEATIGATPSAGIVVLYAGSEVGLDLAAPRLLHQDMPGVKDKVEGGAAGGESFGGALAAGDFDGDGRLDLAVGVRETVGGADDAGAVHVFYGSKKGLSVNGDELWHQDRSGVKGKCHAFDRFGSALASGDFDADGCRDLAIGIAGAGFSDPDPEHPVGAVAVLMGSKKGLTAKGNLRIRRADLGYDNVQPEADFGWALASGDFDGDLRDELAIGAPSDAFGGGLQAGIVYVVRSGPDGLLSTSAASFTWSQLGSATAATLQSSFGSVLRAGDWNGDGAEDLAVGAVGLGVDGLFAAGGVGILYGGSAGVGAGGAQALTESVSGVPGAAEVFDAFGYSLGGGDIDQDGIEDLVIGVAGEHFFGSDVHVGAVQILRGTLSGIGTADSQVLMQGVDGMPGAPGAGAGFGFAIGS